MGNKRRMSIKREGRQLFAPDCDPCYTYGGKELTNGYDRKCFLEGWDNALSEYEAAMQREAEGQDFDCEEDAAP